MNKKGFISTALIYSFFLVFIAIILSVIITYSSRRVLLSTIKKDIRQVMDSKQDNCFSKGINLLNKCILATYGGVESITELDNLVFSDVPQIDDTGLFKSNDDNGESYYYRGDVENNYVKFGKWSETDTSDNAGKDMYWRIIRINGDGTIRLIYDGTEAVSNGISHTAIIGESAYNPKYDNSKYIGYTYEAEDGTQENSTIKTYIDTWYNNNLKTNYGTYIADSIFCNDRTLRIENNQTYYGAYDRLRINKVPKLTCAQKEDKYTMNAEYGNGYLSNPIGLITVDEEIMAGNISYSNSRNTHYLHVPYQPYWTLSPCNTNNNIETIWSVDFGLFNNSASAIRGVRPVINLKADTEIDSGNGTIYSPYIIKEVD